MNIVVVEPKSTRTHAVCCGDSFLGELPVDRVKDLMAKRADSMPREDVVVYCVSCVKAMHIGGKRPRYLVDLLFAEDTTPDVFEPTAWHALLDEFIATHYGAARDSVCAPAATRAGPFRDQAPYRRILCGRRTK